MVYAYKFLTNIVDLDLRAENSELKIKLVIFFALLIWVNISNGMEIYDKTKSIVAIILMIAVVVFDIFIMKIIWKFNISEYGIYTMCGFIRYSKIRGYTWYEKGSDNDEIILSFRVSKYLSRTISSGRSPRNRSSSMLDEFQFDVPIREREKIEKLLDGKVKYLTQREFEATFRAR